MLASTSNSSEWNNDDKWSSQVRKSGEMSKTSTGKLVSNELVIDIDMDSKHRHRIGPFSKITFIPEQSEWPIAKDAEPFSRRFNARHWQTFYDLVNVYVFDIGSICVHGKELLRQVTFHQKIRGKSHFQANVRDIWTVDVGKIKWDFWSVSNQLGKFSMENHLWSTMKKSPVSRMQRFTYSQFLCYVLERWIRIQYQILFGSDSWNVSKIHHNTELWTQSTENRWNSSGIFPRIHYIGACPWSPKVHEQNGRTRTIPRTNYLHVDVQWHHMGK